jgi:hypothetical protein
MQAISSADIMIAKTERDVTIPQRGFGMTHME